MWPIFALALALAATGALTGTALLTTAPAEAAAKPLKKGAKGARVRKAQRWLVVRADGIFGPGTKRAVKAFQRRHGLTADGVVGPRTWALIRRVRARQQRSRPPRVASRGPAVVRLQRALGVGADGLFGPATKAAVREFQRRHRLAA